MNSNSTKQEKLNIPMLVRFATKLFWGLVPIIFTLLCFAGCNDQSRNLTVVSGTVKAEGQPVSGGAIMFFPDGGGRPALSAIDSQGRYELTSFKKGDGVSPGTYKVTISVNETRRPNNLPAPQSVDEETEANMAEAKTIWLIPRKYSELHTTTLTAEIKAGKPMKIDFDSAKF